MPERDPPNREQAALWNEASGRTWVELQGLMDGVLGPILPPVLDAGFPGEGGRVLDIGCGAGASTLAMARRLGPRGHCRGADISATLLAAATARAAAEGVTTASFVEADAQTFAFEPAAFDAVISRFGVMFFDDPQAAFANIRRAARPGAKLAFAAWRSPDENPLLTTAPSAVASLLNLPAPVPDAPGPFAFADRDRVARLLAASGWSDVVIRALDAPTVVVEDDVLAYATRLGPVGRALVAADEPTRVRATDELRAAVAPFMRDGAAHFTAACWLVSATA